MSEQILASKAPSTNVAVENQATSRPANEGFLKALAEQRGAAIDREHSKEQGAAQPAEVRKDTHASATSQPTTQSAIQTQASPRPSATSAPANAPALDLDKNIQIALQWLKFDPNLRGMVEQILAGTGPKMKMEFVQDVRSIARSFGEDHWSGDAFTLHAAAQSPSGEIRNKVSMSFFNEKLKSDFPALIVALQHELCHVQRFEAGKFDPESRKNEELQAFTASIQGLEAIIKGVRESAAKLEGASKENMLKMAAALEAKLPKEREELETWKKP